MRRVTGPKELLRIPHSINKVHVPPKHSSVYRLDSGHRERVSLKDDGPTGQTTGQRGSDPSASAPRPHIGSRSRARHILSVPVLFLTGNEP